MDDETERETYLQWCKDRAMEYAREGRLREAVASMISDMDKRPDTKVHSAMQVMGMWFVLHNGQDDVARWIEGFR